MKFTDITLGDASVEAKVETLGVVLDKKLSEISSQVSTVSKLIGPIGPKGDKGDIGLQGIAGINGQNGKDGLPGRDGKDGKDGVDGSHGISVVNASVALDGALVLELSDGTEVDVGEVVGPAGAGGLNGAQGPMGLQGPQGEQGIQGVKGDTGDIGLDGAGVAVGGTTGQVLAKIDNTDYNTQWVTPASSGTVTSVEGTGTVSGLTLTGTVTSSGNLTLGGTLSATSSNISDFSTAADARIGAASINALSDVIISSPANTQVLSYNGTNWVNAAAPSGGTLLAKSTSVFTTGSAQTYTAPTNTQWVKVTVIGPGGNGGGAFGQRGSGGGGGGKSVKWLAMNEGQTLIYTVGTASGTASTVSSGTLTITTISAGSGNNGTGTAYAASVTHGGAGGSADGGDLNITGGQGRSSYGSGTFILQNFSGAGGDCTGFGVGGPAIGLIATAGIQGNGFGAGGGGALGSSTTAAGRGGVIIFEAY